MQHRHMVLSDACGSCRFCFCRFHGMVPLRYIPLAPFAMSALLARFTAAADKKALTRELRSGMVFGRMLQAQLFHNGHENRVSIANGGQWSINCDTYQNEYLHPAFLNALFGDLVRSVLQCMSAFLHTLLTPPLCCACDQLQLLPLVTYTFGVCLVCYLQL